MDNVNVYWLSLREGVLSRGQFDDTYAGDLLKDFDHHEVTELPETEGGVVILHARFYPKDAAKINKILSKLKWCLVMLIGDEESVFPWDALNHPNMRLWIMHPRPDQDYPDDVRFLPNGYAPDTGLLKDYRKEFEQKPLDWFFSGQMNPRREEAFEHLNEVKNGEFHQTPGFTQGLDHGEYFKKLASAKVAPCPSGPMTPDTFRLYEALEAGCIPIVEEKPSKRGYPGGFWELLFGETPPFPVVADWTGVHELVPELLHQWQPKSNKIQSWWQSYMRKQRHNLETDLHHLMGYEPASKITVLMPSSPISPDHPLGSHPSTAMITETIKSIRDRTDAEIIITLDGVREEQSKRKPQYDEYIRRLLWECNWEHENVLPMVFPEHSHQSGMLKKSIQEVRTPYVIYAEHDTPLNGKIDFPQVASALRGEINLIRFHHETKVGDYHQHLMLDDHPKEINGAPLIRTVQWSQRPHIATTEFYRWLTAEFVGSKSKTMIEFIMLGLVNHAYQQDGYAGWAKFGMALYAPDEEFMQHSINLNGRQQDQMYPTVFQYDGDVPPGSPEPKED